MAPAVGQLRYIALVTIAVVGGLSASVSTPDDADASPAVSFTLRAAVQEANATAAMDIIELPARSAPYLLTLDGVGPGAGELPLTSDVVPVGTGGQSKVLALWETGSVAASSVSRRGSTRRSRHRSRCAHEIGGRGSDTLRGGADRNELHGERGHDQLRGGRGRDGVYSEKGRDRLTGGREPDRLMGGKGRDFPQRRSRTRRPPWRSGSRPRPVRPHRRPHFRHRALGAAWPRSSRATDQLIAIDPRLHR